MKNMEKKLSNYFYKKSSNIFEFLVTDHFFEKPNIEIDNKTNFATVDFFRKDIAFECILDERESDVTCKFVKVVNGQKATDYAVNEKGERVRDDLASILRRKGINERLFTKLNKQLEIAEMIKIVLADYAEMLKKFNKDLLGNPEKIFE